MVFKLPLFSPCLLLIFSKLAPAIFVSSFDFFSFKFFIYKYMLFIFAMHLLLCSKFVYIQDPDISFYFIFLKKNIFNFHNASIALQWFWIYWVLIFNTCIKWCSCILGLYKLNIERQVLPLKVDATFFFPANDLSSITSLICRPRIRTVRGPKGHKNWLLFWCPNMKPGKQNENWEIGARMIIIWGMDSHFLDIIF